MSWVTVITALRSQPDSLIWQVRARPFVGLAAEERLPLGGAKILDQVGTRGVGEVRARNLPYRRKLPELEGLRGGSCQGIPVRGKRDAVHRAQVRDARHLFSALHVHQIHVSRSAHGEQRPVRVEREGGRLPLLKRA